MCMQKSITVNSPNPITLVHPIHKNLKSTSGLKALKHVFSVDLISLYVSVNSKEICNSGASYLMCPLCNTCKAWNMSDICTMAKVLNCQFISLVNNLVSNQ